MEFIRQGGLSPVIQKGYDPKMPTFHCPPAKKGIYAFPFGYVEPFLLSGNYNPNHKNERGRRFQHNGLIWHHLKFGEHGAILIRGKWILSFMNVYEEALRKELHQMRATNHRRVPGRFWKGDAPNFQISSPNGCTKDHLEVFIEKIS